MSRNTLKAITPAGPATPEVTVTLEAVEVALSEAYCAFLAPKSILDLLSAHDLMEDAGEVFFALERLMEAADKELQEVQHQLGQLRSRVRQEQRA